MLDYNQWRIERGLGTILPSFRKKVRSLSLSDEAYGGLKVLAKQHGAIYGEDISVSRFIEMIGLHYLKIAAQDDEGQLVTADPDRTMKDELKDALDRVAPSE